MFENNTSNDSENRTAELIREASKMPVDSIGQIIASLAMHAVLRLPSEVKTSVDGIMELCRTLIECGARQNAQLPEPNKHTHAIVCRALSISKGLTGPDRALGSAIKLYHERKYEVNARTINLSNDECKGEFISNITTAISSAVREGHLEEIDAEGHATYRVTSRGFTFFDLKVQKLKAQSPSHFEKKPEEVAA